MGVVLHHWFHCTTLVREYYAFTVKKQTLGNKEYFIGYSESSGVLWFTKT